ncbi:ABC transporter ATP-binding protein [Nocardia asiatica]|uniref:ABC transporter ATP-binding protein n=1 Tax=Nocardia asiatica TaxID=209252 RepID=UPI002458457B|nr:ABC transporter ATP-binding protein [Nocardia asiatica]
MRGEADSPGESDVAGPWRFYRWLLITQWRRALLGVTLVSAYMILLTVPPKLVSRAIDGVQGHNSAVFLGMSGALLGIGVVLAVLSVLQYRTMMLVCTDAYIRTIRLLTHTVTRLGPALRRKLGAGEVVAVGSTDVEQIALALMIAGPGLAGVLGYCAVAVVLLGISWVLAAAVLLGVPLMMVLMGPLLKWLQQAEADYREQQGKLTAMAGDIVAGLRVICGIGGKEVFFGRYRVQSEQLREEGYRVAAVTSWIGALSLALPMVFVAVVTWLAARMAAAGQIGVGDMVAVYGYMVTLSIPVRSILLGIDDLGRYPVLARRLLRVLSVQNDVSDTGTCGWPDTPGELYDSLSGLRLPDHGLVAVAAAKRGDVVEMFERLARFRDSVVTVGSTPLREMRLDEVRRQIVLVDNDAYLFAGSVRAIVAGSDEIDDSRVSESLRIAAAQEIVSGLPHGMDSILPDQAKTLSGGQRQRLRLARAVYSEAAVLLLMEPTSAVDSHTEALIAARLYAARRHQVTVVATTSPIMLDRADLVVYLPEDDSITVGAHRDLLRDQPGYRALVLRESVQDAAASTIRTV